MVASSSSSLPPSTTTANAASVPFSNVVSSGTLPFTHNDAEDDRSDTSNDSDGQSLKIDSSEELCRGVKPDGTLTNGDQSKQCPTPIAVVANVSGSRKAVEVETVPAMMITDHHHRAISSWRDDDERRDEEDEEELNVEDYEDMQDGGLEEEEDEEGDERVGNEMDPEEEDEEEDEEEVDRLNASVFRPWADDDVDGDGTQKPESKDDSTSAQEQPKFMTWAEMVAAHHPHNPFPPPPPLVKATECVSVETVGPKFVEWSGMNSDQVPLLTPAVGSSESRGSLDVEVAEAYVTNGEDSGASGAEKRGQVHGVQNCDDEVEDGSSATSLSEEGDGDEDLGEGDVFANHVGEKGEATECPLPSLPGWMNSLKPKKSQSTGKKRRRMTPKT